MKQFSLMCALTILGVMLNPRTSQAIDPPHWDPVGPMFENQTQFEWHLKGYGDWCPATEGPHPGVDFDATDIIDNVLAPFDFSGFSGGVVEDEVPQRGWEMCFLEDTEDEYGWGIGHLDIQSPAEWPFLFGSQIAARFPITTAIEPSGSHTWRHIHLSWIEDLNVTQPGVFVGYFNPLDYLDVPLDYDHTYFTPVHFLEDLLNGAKAGIWFAKDNQEDPDEFPGGMSQLLEFQNVIWGVVDLVVSPHSSWYTIEQLSLGSGVRSLEHSLRRQDPYTGSYGNWQTEIYGSRILASFDGELPFGYSSDYEALFYDDEDVSTAPDGEWTFRSSYIITNCGVDDIGANGLSNIVSDAAHHDWTTGAEEYCLGGWDTRLWPADSGGTQSDPMSHISQHSAFPDGRYAIQVSAESHGTGDICVRNLPAVDVTQPESPENRAGVVVDNFIPSIEELKVYMFDLQVPDSPANVIYTEAWEIDQEFESRERSCDPLAYLEDEPGTWGLGVAVRYSEPLDPDEEGFFWFTAQIGDEVYSSEDEKTRWLKPADSIRRGLNTGYSGADPWYWQCYETSEGCGISAFGEYLGALSLHIGNSSVILREAEDLAGNNLDFDPSTVADARDPSTGVFDYTYVEDGPYSTESWGTPSYYEYPGMGIYRGDVFDYFFFVEPYVTGLFLGNCPYWCGFWLLEPDAMPTTPQTLRIHVVKPDDNAWSYIYAVGSGTNNIGWMNYFLYNNNNRIWIAWGEETPPPTNNSDGSLYEYQTHVDLYASCVESDTYLVGSTHLASGINWYYSPYAYLTTCSIVDVDEDTGVAEVEVSIFTGTPWQPSWDVYTTYVDPPSSNNQEGDVSDIPLNSHTIDQTPVLAGYINDLAEPYPCPASEYVIIPCSVERESLVRVNVYDLTGRCIYTVSEGDLSAGNHEFSWNLLDRSGNAVPAGLYIIRMTSDDFSGTSSLVVTR